VCELILRNVCQIVEEDTIKKHKKTMSHHSSSDSDDDDDDFGNFSDASFESEDTTTQSTEKLVGCALDELFGHEPTHYKTGTVNSGDPDKILAGLLADERPNVIYHQLVDSDNRDIPAFIWNRSNLRSTLLHILRLKDPQTLLESSTGSTMNDTEKNLSLVTMDDSLYLKAMALVQDTENPVNDNTLLLKERFGIGYIPQLTQPSLTADFNRELKEKIPSLLNKSIDGNTTDDMDGYHDTICNAIDLLIVELRSLYEKQLQLENDKQTYERVITNLSGHTQRLQRDEIAMFNKKKTQYKRWHRFSWGGK